MLSEQDKTKLTDLFIGILNIHDITSEIKSLNDELCLTIFNEIVDCLKNSIDLGVYIKNVDTEDKPGVILTLVIEVLSSSRLEDNISPEVREHFKTLSNNAEVMNIVLKVVSTINAELLKSLDNNNDGQVTIEEVENDIVDCLMNKNGGGCSCYKEAACCSCCPGFSRKVGKIFATFFIKVLCCGCEKNYITR
jgi:hypothetical protein